ncbi:cell division protein FtsQ/DivIB [Mesobacterium pallidum]|uniref:cell division protein FtsQ/DivIB n=1 Tax=Mesobacterium pallidum TaxID=2872037 RepID=UPI001EE31D25|nr:cell division protein FtsQ/DivIB [Mesobacterium pallidum]
MQSMTRPDPAPSRLRYRLHRLMLTPAFRLGLRVGVPFAIALTAGTIWFADEGRRDAFVGGINDLQAAVKERPEFMVNLMAIDGASEEVAEDIREIVPLDFPMSSFDLDLDEVRRTVAGLDPVARAQVRIRPGGVLQIDVTERVPAILWRTADGVEMLDKTGAPVRLLASRLDRPDLPLIAGEGAGADVPAALELIAAAAPLSTRLRGLVRMGDRRWDVVLDRGQRILLPETDPVMALERVIALHSAQDLLDRDVSVVDMRNAARPTLRMTDAAVQELWRVRQIEPGDH